ncbi:MAG: YitT family protein [Clostridia bacterium]|nr:YitT family protein [Clostridia bacterium]
MIKLIRARKQVHRAMPPREIALSWIQIIVGCVLGGAAYPLFLTPRSIAPGGLTGVAMILNHYFFWPVGLVSLAMNIPLFLIGYLRIGGRFVIRSLGATVLFSLAIDLLPFQPLSDDVLLCAICGGALLGIGLGLILRGGATTGGTDMIAKLVHRRFPTITVAAFLFALDFMVVIAVWVTIGGSEALYALICIYVSSKVIDVVMVGFTAHKACYIMSSAWETISKKILSDMNRGCTQVKARGAYTMEERPLLLCVISRQELPELKTIVREADPSAFMFITEAFEALGEGFTRLDADE